MTFDLDDSAQVFDSLRHFLLVAVVVVVVVAVLTLTHYDPTTK